MYNALNTENGTLKTTLGLCRDSYGVAEVLPITAIINQGGTIHGKIEKHITLDKKIVEDPLANPAARRHTKEELHELEDVEHHKEEIELEIIMILML